MTNASELPTFDDVRAAAERIAPFVHRTPVETSRMLDAETGARVFCKCENLQKVGAFKARGAVNAVLSLSDEQAARGVVAHSSGNHAAALAYAARIRGIACTIVMPKTASVLKRAATRGYGATIVLCEEGERESACERVQAESGATFIHPNADPRVIAGQGTAALELLEQVGDLDVLIAPVGGGGLLAGSALTMRARCGDDARVIGAEPEAVDDAWRSLTSGVRQPRVENPKSWADGLLTGLGEINFRILRAARAEVVTVSEETIVEAARFHLTHMKIVVEPSGATPLAALRKIKDELAGKRVGLVLSGGNTDFQWLAR
jgi:threonine dehydratase